MTVDAMILACALGGFLGYFLIQLIVFRLIDHRGILQGLMNTFFMGGAINIALSVWLLSSYTDLVAFGALVSFVIYGLICFFYVLYFFGIYESSLRMRLLRELYRHYPQGVTLDVLLQSYNAQKIMQTRLERFVGSGGVIVEDNIYRIGKQSPIFVLLESIPLRILKWITKGQSTR